MAGTRERWLAALLTVILSAPIIGITLYFFDSVQRRVASAQNERLGLLRLAQLEDFLADAIRYTSAAACPNAASNLAVLRAQTDTNLAQLESLTSPGPKPSNLAAIHSSWEDLRLKTGSNVDFSPLFDALTAAFIDVSDNSGLTFDSEIEGLDLGDSLAYRLPRAIAQFGAAKRDLCSIAEQTSLQKRFDLAIADASGQERAHDAFQDIDDALQRGDASSLLDVSRAYAQARDRLEGTTRILGTVMMNGATSERTPAGRSLDELAVSLESLMTTEIPTIDRRVSNRIGVLKGERLLYIVSGLLGLVAATAIVFLALRVLYARAKLRVVEQTAAEHERTAMHDSLTGLLNRRALLAALENASPDGDKLGMLCLIDIDHFKAVNDTYGHLTGDDVLQRLARIIEGAIRSTDVAARLGGDEFAIFLRSPIDRQGVERVLTTITTDAGARAYLRGQLLKSTVSVGAGPIYGNSPDQIDAAFAVADKALYEAKRNRGSMAFAEEPLA